MGQAVQVQLGTGYPCLDSGVLGLEENIEERPKGSGLSPGSVPIPATQSYLYAQRPATPQLPSHTLLPVSSLDRAKGRK